MIRVSVIIPTHGRPDSLARCLASLTAQAFPRDDFEVLVVDDGGVPPAERTIPPALAEALRPVLIRQSHRGPGAARMTGVRAAHGEILAFLDDDCGVPEDYLATVVRVFETHPDLQVGQVRLDNPEPANVYGVAWKVALEETLRLNIDESAGGLATCGILGGVMVCRPALFARAGFDPALPRTREDADLRCQLRAGGIPIHYTPDIRVWHYCRRTLRGFVAQYVGYGRGEYDLRQKWGTSVPPANYPRLLSGRSLRTLVSDHGTLRGTAIYGLFVLKRFAGTSGLLYESVLRRHPRSGPARWSRLVGVVFLHSARWLVLCVHAPLRSVTRRLRPRGLR